MYSINRCFLSLPATGVDVTMRLVDGSKKFCHSAVCTVAKRRHNDERMDVYRFM